MLTLLFFKKLGARSTGYARLYCSISYGELLETG